MSMWTPGSSNSTGTSAPITVSITPSTGDTIFVSIGCASQNTEGLLDNMSLADNRGNVYTLAATSPIQGGVGGPDGITTALAVFIAYNCPAGVTVITLSGPSQANYAIVADRCSGAVAVAGVSFNSTAAGSGLTSIDSGSILVTGTRTVYSAAFGDLAGLTWTPSGGFNQMQNQNTANTVSLATFNQNVSGGSIDNNVSASGAPTSSLHVVTLVIAPTIISSTVRQIGYGALGSIVQHNLAVPFPYPTLSGSLLVLLAQVYERGNYAVTDTQSNAWVVLEGPGDTSPNWVMAYTLAAQAGSNTVTLNGTTGGTDISFKIILAEYNVQQAVFTASSVGAAVANTVNTGNIAASIGNTLLVSGLVAINNGDNAFVNFPVCGTSPLKWRYQLSDSGLFTEAIASIALADQVVNVPGTYSNTFTITTPDDQLYAIILGFSIAGGRVNGAALVTPCGKLPTLEVTRDVDDDWTDESTIYITQDEPLPFTLRALVIRDNYNTD